MFDTCLRLHVALNQKNKQAKAADHPTRHFLFGNQGAVGIRVLSLYNHMVRQPCCVFINCNWIKLTVEHNYLVVRYMSFIT